MWVGEGKYTKFFSRFLPSATDFNFFFFFLVSGFRVDLFFVQTACWWHEKKKRRRRRMDSSIRRPGDRLRENFVELLWSRKMSLFDVCNTRNTMVCQADLKNEIGKLLEEFGRPHLILGDFFFSSLWFIFHNLYATYTIFFRGGRER